MTVFIHVSAKTSSALHVGGGASGEDDHALFRRREDGALLLPGTGIAGALRAHLTRIVPAMTGLEAQGYKVVCDALNPQNTIDEVCGCVVCHLMGDVFPGTTVVDGHEIKARASRLIIDDVVVPSSDTHIRDGVGIDRVTGAANREARAKFALETVAREIEFGIDIELEEDDDAAKIDIALLALVLDEWHKGRIRLGGRSNRGLGAIEILTTDAWKLDTAYRVDDLMVLLHGDPLPDEKRINLFDSYPPRSEYQSTYEPEPGSVQSWIEIKFDVQAQGFFLANDASQADAIGFGHVSMDSVLPGSSLRGVLRSQAERIARTITNLTSENEHDFLDHCPASNPLALRRSPNDPHPELEAGVSRLQWSNDFSAQEKQQPTADMFDLADRLFGNTHFGSRLVVEDLSLIGDPVWKPLDFLAIDRFTGGGADKLKFDALALWQPRFAGRLYLEAPLPWELGWLLYTLKDLIDERVTVGFGGAKGFGRITLENVRITIGRAYAEAFPVPGSSPPDDERDGFFQTLTVQGWENILHASFDVWGQAWLDEVQNYEVDGRIKHADNTDYYWRARGNGPPIYWLYPKGDDIDALLHS